MIDNGTFALILLALGFALIVAEVFIPSGGLLFIAVVITFALSIFFAHTAWWSKSPGTFWTYLGAMLVLIPGFAFGLFRALDRTRLGDRILLHAPTSEEVTPYRREVERLNQLIGKRGTTLTILTPGGLVQVDKERLHCVSEGVMIQSGEPVEVVGVQGTRIIVRAASHTEVAKSPSDVFLDDSELEG